MPRTCTVFWLGLVTLALAAPASAAQVVVVAGGGSATGDRPAQQCRLVEPFGIVRSPSGEFYLVEMTIHRLSRIDRQGILQPLTAGDQPGNSGDGGPASAARLNGPHALAIAPDGAVYLADTWNSRVRRFDPRDGKMYAFAGTGVAGFSGDGGPAVAAQFGNVYDIAFDAGARRMVVADLDNRRIRAIDMRSGLVSTIAGNGERGIPADGALAVAAPLVDPRAVAVDAHDQVYIAERSGHALRVVDGAGRIRTVAGNGAPGARGDGGAGRDAQLNGPKHLDCDPAGNVLIADTENHRIRRYRPATGTVELVAGTGEQGRGGIGGPPEQLQLDKPHGVYLAPDGAIYVSDSGNGRILRIEP